MAKTWYVYFAVSANPVSEYVVSVLSVFDTIVFQVEPQSVDLSILYPVTAEPPLLLGAVQLRLICDDETAVATRFRGSAGGVIHFTPHVTQFLKVQKLTYRNNPG